MSQMKTGNFHWGGVTSFVVDEGNDVMRVNAVKISGSYYELVTLTPNDKVDKSNIGDYPEKFREVGVAAICTDPKEGPDRAYEIYADSETEKWTSHELKVEV